MLLRKYVIVLGGEILHKKKGLLCPSSSNVRRYKNPSVSSMVYIFKAVLVNDKCYSV